MFFWPLTSTIRLCLAENSYLQGHRMQCRKCMLLLPIGARRSAYILGFFKTKTFSKPIPRLAKPYQNQYPKPPKPPQNQYSKPKFQNHFWVWCMPILNVCTNVRINCGFLCCNIFYLNLKLSMNLNVKLELLLSNIVF